MRKTSAKDKLLDQVFEYVAEHGAHDLTVRGLAAALGTSHRMLLYHFGSREGLLAAVVARTEADQREFLLQLSAEENPLVVMWRTWKRLADPAIWPQEKLFFELYSRALRGDPGLPDFLDGVVEKWIDPVAKLYERVGFRRAKARNEARLAVAVARGLLLDLLATEDRHAVDRAMKAFLSRYGEK